MANRQLEFLYDEVQLNALTNCISVERLRKYIASVRAAEGPSDRLRKVIRLYEKNTAYREAMYTVLQGFEVTFRNAIHTRLSADHGTTSWFDSLPLLPDENDTVARAKQTITDKPQEVTPDRVIGELSFGFWVRLFSGEYANTLWGPSLKNILPVGSERGSVYNRFKNIKTLRNRIAHHNRIIGRPPSTVKQHYEEIMETIGWLDGTVQQWVATTNTFYPRFAKPLYERPAVAQVKSEQAHADESAGQNAPST